MHIPKTVFLTLRSFRKLFLRAIRIQDFRNFSLEESLSKTTSLSWFTSLSWLQKWCKVQIYSVDAIFYILLFYHSLEAGNPKYDKCRNKNFANFKGLTENKEDLAFSLKSRALQFENLYSLQPSSGN